MSIIIANAMFKKLFGFGNNDVVSNNGISSPPTNLISGSTSIIVPNIRFLVTSGVVLLSDKIANATVIKIIRKIIGVYQEGLIIPIQSPDHVTGMSVCLLRLAQPYLSLPTKLATIVVF